jgi:hypothetical protein
LVVGYDLRVDGLESIQYVLVLETLFEIGKHDVVLEAAQRGRYVSGQPICDFCSTGSEDEERFLATRQVVTWQATRCGSTTGSKRDIAARARGRESPEKQRTETETCGHEAQEEPPVSEHGESREQHFGPHGIHGRYYDRERKSTRHRRAMSTLA